MITNIRWYSKKAEGAKLQVKFVGSDLWVEVPTVDAPPPPSNTHAHNQQPIGKVTIRTEFEPPRPRLSRDMVELPPELVHEVTIRGSQFETAIDRYVRKELSNPLVYTCTPYGVELVLKTIESFFTPRSITAAFEFESAGRLCLSARTKPLPNCPTVASWKVPVDMPEFGVYTNGGPYADAVVVLVLSMLTELNALER